MQTVTRQDHGPIKMLGVNISNTRPHWLRYGNGHAAVGFEAHDNAEWLSIDTSEYGPSSSKRTMVTLDRAAALALRDLLNEVFSEPSP